MQQNQLRELVKASNPVPNPAVFLREDSDLHALFQDVMHRVDDPQTSMSLLDDVNWRSNMETKHEALDLELSPEQNERKWWPAATLAAVAVTAIVLLVFAVQPDDDPSEPVATDDGAISTTAVSGFSSEDALAVADAYFAANSAGDFGALQALFVADPEFTGQFGIAEDEQLFAWNVVQGTTVSPPDCTVVNGIEGTVTVICRALNHDALVQAVEGPPVPIQLTLKITHAGIVEENGVFAQPDFNTVARPFEWWVTENHPEDLDKVGFGAWSSIEEAEAFGVLRAQYAAEWATHLEANGCAYDDGC